jgi:hypothetical protein
MTGRQGPEARSGRRQREARAAFSSLGWRLRKKRRGRAYSQGSGTRGSCALEVRPSAQASLQYQIPPTLTEVSSRGPRHTGQEPPPFETQRDMAGQRFGDRRRFGKRRQSEPRAAP